MKDEKYVDLQCKNKKLRIAYFSDTNACIGGAGNLLLQQAKLMSALYEVIVVIPCDEQKKVNKEYIRRCNMNGIPFAVLQYVTSYNFYNVDFCAAVQDAERIEEFAVKENIGFFHSVQLNVAVEIVARKLQIPHLMDIYQLKRDEFRLKFGDIYPRYHLCDSQMYSELWREQLGITSKCVRPVAPLCKMEKKHNYKSDGLKIVMLGAVCSRKNQLAAIKAVEKCIGQYKMELFLAGDVSESYAIQCQKYVRENDLDEYIHFLGFVTDVFQLLKQCDCLLCSSSDESFPSSIVEALTYDLTIITTPVAGVPEIFQEGKNAFVSCGFTSEEIYDSLINCLKAYEDKSISLIHKNAENTWKQNFSPDIVQEQIQQYYVSIMADCDNKGNNYDKIVNDIAIVLQRLKNKEDARALFQKRSLYYLLLKQKITQGKAYIWGAGMLGKQSYELINALELPVELIAFIDKNKSGEYCGYSIVKPESLKYSLADYVFISFAMGREEVIEYLQSKGLEYNRNIWLLP